MKDIQKIKEFFSKPLKEERDIYDEIANEEFGMDYDQLGPNEKEWVRDEISNMDEAVEKYTVAGRPVTLNKGKKTNGTDWTVTFLSDSSIGRKGEEIPLSDVLSLIKPFPKGITMNEAEKEDAVDTITMDIPLFLRMLEYSREDAQKDVDLHSVTDKAISLGKEKGILSIEDYDEIIGTAEEIDEAELIEANVPSNIAEFAKRKGISSLVRKVAGWAEKVGARIAGGTAVGKNYSTLVLDLDYKQQGEIRINTDEETIELYDEPVSNFNQFQRVYMYGPNWERKDLEEGTEEQLSFISKARAKSSLRQFLSGKRDDGMGKFDAIVYGIDADGNKHQIKSYNDLQNYEEFALGDNPDFVKEAKKTSLDSETIKQIKDDIKGFPKYQKRGFESFKKEVREKYKITPKQLEDILHGDLKESKEDIRETIKFIKENNPKATIEEIIAELKEIKALGQQLNEELCPAGKAYIKRRQAAGEKSSAYLSGRGVKVCKGQMSGRKKKK